MKPNRAFIETPLGTAELEGDKNGLTGIRIADVDDEISQTIPKTLLEGATQLQEYFSGSRNRFDLKLNPQGTDFQKKVWNELLNIPYGNTISYLELSKRLGDIKAVRAVAAANGKNPLWIVTPCHRVIGSDGSLTGYAGGLHRKKWLLEHESQTKQGSLW